MTKEDKVFEAIRALEEAGVKEGHGELGEALRLLRVGAVDWERVEKFYGLCGAIDGSWEGLESRWRELWSKREKKVREWMNSENKGEMTDEEALEWAQDFLYRGITVRQGRALVKALENEKISGAFVEKVYIGSPEPGRDTRWTHKDIYGEPLHYSEELGGWTWEECFKGMTWDVAKNWLRKEFSEGLERVYED